MSALLINEHPLMVLPGLAVKIGLNEAIVLQQIHYWTRDKRHVIDGLSWTYNSIPEWRKQFPFWSEVTIRRTLGSLEEKGLIIRRKLSENRFDATHWYALDMSKLAEMGDHTDAIKMSAPCDQNDRVRSDQIDHITSTENTKTSTETTSLSGKPDGSTEVLNYLNEKAGRSYRPVKANLEKIAARIKEGATLKDMKDVIDQKCKDWKGTKMEPYLRPDTLFNATKFNQYVGQLGMDVKEDAEKPREAPWWSSNEAMLKKGRELGIQPRSGESWQDFRGRIDSKLGVMA